MKRSKRKTILIFILLWSFRQKTLDSFWKPSARPKVIGLKIFNFDPRAYAWLCSRAKEKKEKKIEFLTRRTIFCRQAESTYSRRQNYISRVSIPRSSWHWNIATCILAVTSDIVAKLFRKLFRSVTFVKKKAEKGEFRRNRPQNSSHISRILTQAPANVRYIFRSPNYFYGRRFFARVSAFNRNETRDCICVCVCRIIQFW